MRHRVLFALAGLVSAVCAAQAADAPTALSGAWKTDFGLTQLSDSGGRVTGSYPFENGQITGTLQGQRLTGQWTQSHSARPCAETVNGSAFHGRLVFEFTGDAFVGQWGYCDDAPTQRWSGQRVSNATATTPPVPPTPPPLAASVGLAPTPCTNCPPWVAGSFVSHRLPLAAEALTWSDPKRFNRKGGPLTVQSRFLEQHGTTCKFEVQFNNIGAAAVDERLLINRPGKAAVSQYDAPLRAKLAAGESVAYGTEVRECPLQWGKSQDMSKCAACEPMVYFVGD